MCVCVCVGVYVCVCVGVCMCRCVCVCVCEGYNDILTYCTYNMCKLCTLVYPHSQWK